MMNQLAKLAEDQIALENSVRWIEEQLKTKKEKLRRLTEETLPQAMEALGLHEFTTDAGLKIQVQRKVHASISKDRTVLALDWLRQNGHGKMIRNEITVYPDNGEQIAVVKAALAAQNYTYEEGSSVHSSTLAAWAREMLADGKEFPHDLFGIFVRRVSKVETLT